MQHTGKTQLADELKRTLESTAGQLEAIGEINHLLKIHATNPFIS